MPKQEQTKQSEQPPRADHHAPDQLQAQTGDRGWLSISFDGFMPNDGQSSLFRKWEGYLTALRSDGALFKVRITAVQSDTPAQFGNSLFSSLAMLERFRTCPCIPGQPCADHIDFVENGSGGPVTD